MLFRFIVLIVLITGPSGGSSLYSQTRETDELVLRNFQEVTAWLSEVQNDVSDIKAWKNDVERQWKAEERELALLIAKKGAEDPELMKLGRSLANFASRGQSGNKRSMFLSMLAVAACENYQDGCEFRKKLEDYERRLDLLESQDLEPTPAPTPSVPPVAEHAPQPSPRMVEPQAPIVRWDGHIDAYTDFPETICRRATLIAKCRNYTFSDGLVHHGDVYLTCGGQFVLLRHAPTYDSYVAYR